MRNLFVIIVALLIVATVITQMTRPEAEGGIKKISGGYVIHTFTNDSELIVSRRGLADILLVGGGGGGACGGGGGGAGGVLYTNCMLVSGVNPVIVGCGGAPGFSSSTTADRYGTDGTASGYGPWIVPGGGGGGFSRMPGRDGASGGGGGHWGAQRFAGGSGIEGFGRDGGSSGYIEISTTGGRYGSSGGGGGAGAPGGDANYAVIEEWDSSLIKAGAGGDGLAFDISGTLTWYAGGGGGGSSYGTGGAAGGFGGGGNGGGGNNGYGADGADGTGGGGGGGGLYGNLHFEGGKGGDGIVIIRYLAPSGTIFVLR